MYEPDEDTAIITTRRSTISATGAAKTKGYNFLSIFSTTGPTPGIPFAFSKIWSINGRAFSFTSSNFSLMSSTLKLSEFACYGWVLGAASLTGASGATVASVFVVAFSATSGAPQYVQNLAVLCSAESSFPHDGHNDIT